MDKGQVITNQAEDYSLIVSIKPGFWVGEGWRNNIMIIQIKVYSVWDAVQPLCNMSFKMFIPVASVSWSGASNIIVFTENSSSCTPMVFTHFHMYVTPKNFFLEYLVGCRGAQLRPQDMLYVYIYEAMNDKRTNLSLTYSGSHKWLMMVLGRNL